MNIGYDNLQRETSLSATVAGTADFLNNYTYNAGSQLTQIKQQSQTGGNSVAPKVVNFTYNADGQYSTINRYANLAATQLVATTTYGYNANSDLTSLSHDKGATNLNSYTWSYDHDGRVTGDSSIDGTDSFSYDASSQVTAATHSYQTNESYSYDSNGNRTNTGYTTGTNNQLSSDGTYNYLYDANGNMTKKTTISTGAYVTYTWDYRNRLTDVQAYNSSNVLQSHIHYTYDVFDRLIERQVDPTGGGTYTSAKSYIYKGNNVILVYNGSGTLTDRLLFTPSPLGGEGRGEGLLADENGSGTVSWLLADNEGTIRDVVQYNSGTDTTTVVDHLKFDSFGNITAQTNSAYQPLFAYTGQMWDAAAALYYYHARWCDPHTGRFISQDPTGFAAGDANLYRYVGNSPTNATDPTGQDAQPANMPADMAQNMADMEKVDEEARGVVRIFTDGDGKPKLADTPNSMDWTQVQFVNPAGEIRGGLTVTSFTVVPNVVKVAAAENMIKWEIQYQVQAMALILLDVEGVRRVAMTLPGAYGHEQLHVKYFMQLMQKLQDDMAKMQKKQYPTEAAANAAARAAMKGEIKKQADAMRKSLIEDAKHRRQAEDAAKEGTPANPIGDMPENPITIAPEIMKILMQGQPVQVKIPKPKPPVPPKK